MNLINKPCGFEYCEFTTEICGEAGEPIRRCQYPDVQWVRTQVDQRLECDPCKRLVVHCGSLVDIRISHTRSDKITFRLHGVYNRPITCKELCISFQETLIADHPTTLILRRPGYLCEAFNAHSLTLDIGLPKGFCFETLAIFGKTILCPVQLQAADRLRLDATDNIVAKLQSRQVFINANTEICLACEAPNETTTVEIHSYGRIELQLIGYSGYDLICPVADRSMKAIWGYEAKPILLCGEIISGIEDVTIM